MKDYKLKIEIDEGSWMVDVVTDANDSGIYELIHPQQEAVIKLEENQLYGFKYSISAPQGTAFTVTLNDDVLASGQVDDSQIARGNGVF